MVRKDRKIIKKHRLDAEWIIQSTELTKGQWETMVDRKLLGCFKKAWKKNCESNKKLELYTEHGGFFGIKDYLGNFKIRIRDIMARLRSRSNSLRIDSGRRIRRTRGERNCLLCRKETEDATHFLLRCPVLDKNREILRAELTRLRETLPVDEKWDLGNTPWEKLFFRFK